MTARIFQMLAVFILAVVAITDGQAADLGCGTHTESAANQSALDSGIPAEALNSGPVEHQILFVENWRSVISGSVASSANTKITAGLAVFLTGTPSPSTDVTNAIIEFLAPGEPLRQPTYNAQKKQIKFSMHLDHYASFVHAISQCTPIYMQYRRYKDGHVFADLHIGAVPVRP